MEDKINSETSNRSIILFYPRSEIIQRSILTAFGLVPTVEVISQPTIEKCISWMQNHHTDYLLIDFWHDDVEVCTSTIRKFKKLFPHTRQVVLSLHSGEEFETAILEAGAFKFFPPDFQDELFNKALSQQKLAVSEAM